MVHPPQHLMHPRIAWRVLTGGRQRGLPVQPARGESHTNVGTEGNAVRDDGAAIWIQAPGDERTLRTTTPASEEKSCLRRE